MILCQFIVILLLVSFADNVKLFFLIWCFCSTVFFFYSRFLCNKIIIIILSISLERYSLMRMWLFWVWYEGVGLKKMNDTASVTESALAISDTRPKRSGGGCVGIFFQLFDWNRRFANKKIFSKRLLPPGFPITFVQNIQF